MATYDVFGAQTRKPGYDSALVLYAADGGRWEIAAEDTGDQLTFAKDGVDVARIYLGGIGYSTGAGGAVTQITNASTAVTLNKPCGQITTVALTTAGAAEEAFVVNNSYVVATDVIALSTTYAGAGKPFLSVSNVGAGVFTVNITNVSASALDALAVINFAVIKTVAA